MFCYNSVHVALPDFFGLNLNFLVEEVLVQKKKIKKNAVLHCCSSVCRPRLVGRTLLRLWVHMKIFLIFMYMSYLLLTIDTDCY